MKTDRTYQAVKRQLEQMGGDAFRIGVVFDDKHKATYHRNWSKDEVLDHIPSLKRENARGAHIFIKPNSVEHNLVMIDDVGFDDVENMAKNGHKPALVIETSPGNSQAWVKLEKPLREDQRRSIARTLTQAYDADIASADAHHYGRLAGFTNQKPEHQDQRGRYPFVLLRDSNGQVAEQSGALIRQAEQMALDEKARAVDHLKQTVRVEPQAEQAFVADMQLLEARYGRKIDYSRADWMITKRMLECGFEPGHIAGAMIKHSPHIEARKREINVEQYVRRTVGKAQEEINRSYRPGPDRDLSGPSFGPDR